MLKSIFPLTEVLQPQWKSSLEPIAEMQLESSKLIKVCQLVLLLEYQSHLVQSLSSNQLHPPSQEMRLSAYCILLLFPYCSRYCNFFCCFISSWFSYSTSAANFLCTISFYSSCDCYNIRMWVFMLLLSLS